MSVTSAVLEKNGVSLQLDVQQAFGRLVEDINQFAVLDPDIAWVREAITERLGEIPEEDTVRFVTRVWPHLKALMIPDICPSPWPPYHLPHSQLTRSMLPWFGAVAIGSVPRSFITIRHGLVEGETLRRRIEEDLAGPLTADALRKTAKEIREWEYSSDSARTRSFDEARNEVERLAAGPEDKPAAVVAAAILAGAAAAFIGYEIGAHLLS
ncbi:hypothetical protein ACWCYK_31515 [Streptomyces lydicamycinicus]